MTVHGRKHAFFFGPESTVSTAALSRIAAVVGNTHKIDASYEVMSEKILLEDMEAALVDKYGTPTFDSGLRTAGNRTLENIMSWSYDARDNPVSSQQDIVSCASFTYDHSGQTLLARWRD